MAAVPRRWQHTANGACVVEVESARPLPAKSPLAAVDMALLALLVAATFIAYAPALSGGFIWDDITYIRESPVLRSASGLWRIWSDAKATPQFHPLVFTSFWIEYQLWGPNTFGYHLLNVVLHAINALLIWRLLDRLAIPGALLAAALFALHPVHVESVAWICERKDVLSVFFALLCLLRWVRFVDDGGRRDYRLALLFFAASLLSKYVLCTLPLCLWLVAYWRAPQRWRQHLTAVLPFLVIALPVGLIALAREYSHGNAPLGYSIIERTLIASRALVFYATKLLWPSPLTAIYPKWDVDASALHPWLFPVLVVVAVTALWVQRRRWGLGPLLGCAWFLVLLSPQIGLVEFNPMRMTFVFDHIQYLASLGPLTVLAAGVATVLGRGVERGLAVAVIVGLGALTFAQAGVYRDAETFWRDNITKNPQSWAGHAYLANSLVSAGRIDEALPHFATAIEINPKYAVAHNHLGIVLDHLGRAAEAVEHYEAALRIDPRMADVNNNLGVTLTRLGRLDDAAARFAEAVRLNPEYVAAHQHWGIVASQLGKDDEAREHFREVLRLQPEHQAARAALDRLL